MRVKHAFIGLAPAVRMDSPGFPLAVLAGIQVSAGGGGERLRERCVHAVVTEVRDQRSRRLLLRVSSVLFFSDSNKLDGLCRRFGLNNDGR